MNLSKLFAVSAVLTASSVAPLTLSQNAFAHEKSFPAKQLKALSPEGETLVFKEAGIKPSSEKLGEFEKKFQTKFSKGELAGNLFLGSGKDGKVKVVTAFLDGKSDRGETEFGASVDTQGKVAKVAVFSSPESNDATSGEFLASLVGRNTDDLEALKKGLAETDKSKKFIVELTQKALGRVDASFGKK